MSAQRLSSSVSSLPPFSQAAVRPVTSKQTRRGAGLWILVVLPVLAIPVENQYSFFGLSLAKLTIIPLLLTVLLFYPKRLFAMWSDPLVLSGLGFVLWGVISEALRPVADWEFLYRIFQMFMFATLIATVLPYSGGLGRVLLAPLFASSILALYLILNFYGSVSSSVTDYQTASRLRVAAFDDASLHANLNILGYTVGIGAVIAIAKLMGAKRLWTRIGWGGLYVLCAIGTTVPVSRGAFIALLAASVLILVRSLTNSAGFGKVIIIIAVISAVLSLMPDALSARLFSFRDSQKVQTEKQEARLMLIEAAVEKLPEYWALGVGEGYYWKRWGAENGFGRSTPSGMWVLGPHNGFLASWLFFGLPGISLLLLTCFLAARRCPGRANTSWESSALFGLAILGLVWLFFTHNLYLKEFGIIIGLLVGGSKTVSPGRRPRSRVRAPFASPVIQPDRPKPAVESSEDK
jgi:O-antigen ligase/polysaccharide polymerase Wzy-like membrane protein